MDLMTSHRNLEDIEEVLDDEDDGEEEDTV